MVSGLTFKIVVLQIRLLLFYTVLNLFHYIYIYIYNDYIIFFE